MKQLNDYPVQHQYEVHWGQMDAAQHVNNLVYMRWAESARIIFFDQIFGKNYDFSGGVGPILAWQDCKYIFPMTYPDVALIGVKVAELLEDRFITETVIFSKKHDRIAAFGKQTIMAYDYTHLKKAALPDNWTKALRKYL